MLSRHRITTVRCGSQGHCLARQPTAVVGGRRVPRRLSTRAGRAPADPVIGTRRRDLATCRLDVPSCRAAASTRQRTGCGTQLRATRQRRFGRVRLMLGAALLESKARCGPWEAQGLAGQVRPSWQHPKPTPLCSAVHQSSREGDSCHKSENPWDIDPPRTSYRTRLQPGVASSSQLHAAPSLCSGGRLLLLGARLLRQRQRVEAGIPEHSRVSVLLARKGSADRCPL